MPQSMNPRHHEHRAVLRRVGPIVAGVGAVLTVIGLVSFFSAFGTHASPRYFWCAFVGLPLVGIGLAVTKFGYVGAISRYLANEVAPVGKDVVNYMADGTKDAVRDVATAVGEGLAASQGDPSVEVVRCHKCSETNEATARFCKQCGASLAKTKPCSSCHELNDPDARYCDRCGEPMA